MSGAPYGLDHAVVLVNDLDDAARRYERLGFTVAPQMRHPFGTANRLVMLRHSFIELVGVVDPGGLSGPGHLIAHRLTTSGEGAWGLALLGIDIERNRTELAAHGLDAGEVGHGSRPVPLPDGRDGLARFSTLMLPSPPGLDHLLLFLAEQHVPEVVWVPEWQRHPNGAHWLDRVTCVASNPSRTLPLLQSLYGIPQVQVGDNSVTAHTPLGSLETIATAEAERRYGSDAARFAGRIAAVRIETADVDRARKTVEHSGVRSFSSPGAGFHVAAGDACGVVLEFT
jgi:hypothetical protein